MSDSTDKKVAELAAELDKLKKVTMIQDRQIAQLVKQSKADVKRIATLQAQIQYLSTQINRISR